MHPGTGTWRRSMWDQKSCQIGIFITVLMSHGTKNVHKTWSRDLRRPKRLGTTGLGCKLMYYVFLHCGVYMSALNLFLVVRCLEPVCRTINKAQWNLYKLMGTVGGGGWEGLPPQAQSWNGLKMENLLYNPYNAIFPQVLQQTSNDIIAGNGRLKFMIE